MSQEDVVSLADKISGVLEKEKNAKFPCKEKFDEINTKLSEIRSKISASLPQDQTDKLRDALHDLNNILAECLGLSNQQQNVKKSLVIGSPGPSSQEEDDVGDDYEWTCSYVDESMLYGDKDEAEKIIKALVKDEDFNAVGIVGSYGSGKTNLARKVFIDEKVKDEFPLRLWVCVGPDCKKHELLYRMLDNLGLETDEVEEIVNNSKAVKDSSNKDSAKIGVLLFILHWQLSDVKYLIVFDDVWCSTDIEWYRNLGSKPPTDKAWDDRLGYGLPKGNGNAVIVTCRNEKDARTMVDTGLVYTPKRLEVDEGFRLFKRAFDEAKKNSNLPVEEGLEKKLEEMKKQIVDKCLGFPAALMAAGRGLATQQNPCVD
ncbi:putative disease resistance protein [Ananas comosus]|uniref:Putative disease resistance protein n=1 Tax=Ananas comosus TaxID=4615 RepID=A0A199UZ98_ANACO|nr:putative disease resistance protein [Ananas comosus]